MKLTICACVLAGAAFSQSPSSTIRGAITDTDGGVPAIAFVQLKNSQTSEISNAIGSPGGKYSFTPVAAGTYDLSVIVPGMKTYQRKGMVLRPGQTLEINVRVEDGPSLRTLGEDPAAIAAVFINRPPPPDGPTPRTADGKPDLSGVWVGGPTGPEVDMLPWAEALTKERSASNSAGYPPARCLPAGPIPLLGAGFFKLVQTTAVLMMLFEGDTPGYRQVFLDGRIHPKDFGPTWLGHSTGKWNGETLVVDSVGYGDKGWLDFDGHPHTEALHVIQRIRRTNLGNLEIQITADDPGTFRKPWTVIKTAALAPKDEILEYICPENNKDVGHMVGK